MPGGETPRRGAAMTRAIAAGLFMLALAAPAWGQSEQAGARWDELTPVEQHLLKSYEDQWDRLPLERQQRLAHGARRWSGMTTEERDEARQNFQRWRQMTPEERDVMRQRFERFRRLPHEERASLRQAREWFRNLPPERRQRIRERWRNMGPEERREARREVRREMQHDREGRIGAEPERGGIGRPHRRFDQDTDRGMGRMPRQERGQEFPRGSQGPSGPGRAPSGGGGGGGGRSHPQGR